MTNNKKYELIKFEDGDFSLDVNVSPNEDTVWLTQAQIAELFNVNVPAINKHINNILLLKELNESTISKMEIVQIEGGRNITRIVNIYNLYHDRFIVIDDELYNIGSSIKDIGKKISHISKLESINIDELLNKYI